MGLDGGTIISRSDVIRGQSWQANSQDNSRSTRGGSVSTGKPAQQPAAEQQAERVASWTTCSISGQGLTEPIVADGLGRLFNKNGVVEHLLAKKDIFIDGERSVHQYANNLRIAPGTFDNIRTLKDVFQVHIQHGKSSTAPVDATTSSGGGMQYRGDVPTPYFCPVTGLPCTRYAFSALRPCGHVLSTRALACVSKEALACPVCGKPYEEEDVIPINGSKEQVEALRLRLQQQQANPPKPRDGKKSKKKLRDEGCANGAQERGQGPADVLDQEHGQLEFNEDTAGKRPRKSSNQ